MLLTITGPSASGKTSLARALITRIQGSTMMQSVTTREARPSDLHGEYEYVSPEQFAEIETAGSFLWTVDVYGNRYGTRKEAASSAAEENGIVFAILTVAATKTLHAYLKEIGKEEEIQSVYLDIADEDLLRMRLQKRGDTKESIDLRIEQSRTWAEERDQSGLPYIIYDAGDDSDYLAEKVLTVLRKKGKLQN